LSSFLQGRGGNILAAGYRNAGITQNQFQAAMAELRQMEFYMPVESHRRQWSGGPDVLVAIAISKGDAPVAFTTDGLRVELQKTSPPSTPTLIINHIEADFSDQLKINQRGLPAFSCQGIANENLETSAARCEKTVNRTPKTGVASLLGLRQDTRTPNGNFIPAPRYDLSDDPSTIGLYANFFRVMDAKEMWWDGSPEVEVHVTGRRNGPTGQVIDYQCAGEHAGDPTGNQPGIRDYSYFFDMNGNFWSGDVRIVNSAQVDSLQLHEPDGFIVSLWEDDDAGPCNMREDHTGFWAQAVADAAAVGRGVNAIRARGGPQWLVLAGIVGELASLIQGGDQLIGTLVFKDSIQAYANEFPGNTHVIMDAGNFNGRATLYVKRVQRSASIQGLGGMTSGQTSTWTASAGPPAGTVYYAWSVDGEPAQDGTNSQFTYTNSGASFNLSVIARDDQGTIGGAARDIYVSQCEDPTQIDCDPGGGNLMVPASSSLGGASRPQPSASVNRRRNSNRQTIQR
jgi:hypothetical protein